MPEDMKEMYKQRQRELQLERAQMAVDQNEEQTDKNANPDANTILEPRLEDKTLPPAPKSDLTEPHVNGDATKKPGPAPASTPAETRPREAEPNKKKGKKGDDGPPN
jgi:hypothetical protein